MVLGSPSGILPTTAIAIVLPLRLPMPSPGRHARAAPNSQPPPCLLYCPLALHPPLAPRPALAPRPSALVPRHARLYFRRHELSPAVRARSAAARPGGRPVARPLGGAALRLARRHDRAGGADRRRQRRPDPAAGSAARLLAPRRRGVGLARRGAQPAGAGTAAARDRAVRGGARGEALQGAPRRPGRRAPDDLRGGEQAARPAGGPGGPGPLPNGE